MRFRLKPNNKLGIELHQLCDICNASKDLVDAKKHISRSVSVMVKLCRIPCARPMALLVLGYSYDVESWEVK